VGGCVTPRPGGVCSGCAQLSELETELRRAQEAQAARTDEAKQAQAECQRLRARVERLESAAARAGAAQSASALNVRACPPRLPPPCTAWGTLLCSGARV
jgi:hypothetical protein